MQASTNDVFQTRLTEVYEQIAAACQRAERPPDSVTLVGVSKTHPAADVLAVLAAGLTDFGENRPEEAAEKIPAVAAACDTPPRWHMIGHIQSRKARLVVPHFALIHSVDTVKLAAKLSRLAGEAGRTLDVLLEMNISGEESKSGWPAVDWDTQTSRRESLWNDIQSILELEHIRVQGLMTIAPIVAAPEQTRQVFAGLRRLRDALREAFPAAAWDELSMGMSDDFPVAIEEGATIIRVGRAIFGARQVK